MIRTRLSVVRPGGAQVVDVEMPADTPVADVVTALGLPPDTACLDGRPLVADGRCDDVAWPYGAEVGTGPAPGDTSHAPPPTTEWLTGPAAGTARDPAAGGPSVDVGDGFVRIGAHWTVRRAPRHDTSPRTVPPGQTCVLADRSVPVRPAAPTPALPRPAPLPSPPAAPRLSPTMLALPLLVGAVLAVVVSPRLAVFMLLSPLMVLGTWIEGRWSQRRHVRRVRRVQQAHLAALRRAMPAARRAALAQAWQHGTAGDLFRALERGGPGLWRCDGIPQRILVGAGPGRLDLGVADLTADDHAAAALLARASTAVVPVWLPLEAGRTVAVVGPAAVELANAVVLQLAALTGPADLAITADGLGAWTAWLPHTRPTGDGPAAVRLHVTHDHDAAPAPDTILLVVGGDADTVPPAAASVITAARSHCEVHTPDGGTAAAAPVLVTDARATVIARRAARFVDPRTAARPTGQLAVHDLPPEPAGVLPCTLGLSDAGTAVCVDLATDGPHGLITGTTGSGKSELLRTLVATLCRATGPDDLAVLLLDFKGGATFDPLADLPQVVDVLTDLDGPAARRTVRVLAAELRRREHLLRDAGVDDLAGLPAAPPRLVVVVDEVAALLDTVPDGGATLVDLARRGRSLGVHLLLATQRARGVVSDALRANLALRISLRTESTADALDVVGDDTPAHFDRRSPGRALLAGAPPVRFQTALLRPRQRSVHVTVVAGPGTGPPGSLARAEPSSDEVAAAAAELAQPWHGGRCRLRLPAPLPADLTLDDPRLHNTPGAFALVDDPDRLAVTPLAWDLRGHLLVHDLDAAVASDVLVTAALATARGGGIVHLYGLVDGPGQLAPLAAHPHAAGVVEIGDRYAVERLLERLETHDGTHPVVLVAPHWDRLNASLDDARGYRLRARLDALLTAGARRGVVVATCTTRPAAASAAVVGATTTRLVGEVGDASERLLLGLPADHVSTTGLLVEVHTRRQVRVARPDDRTIRLAPPSAHRPVPLPATPRPGDAWQPPPPRTDGTTAAVCVGRELTTAAPAWLSTQPGSHLLVAGRGRDDTVAAGVDLARQLAAVRDVVLVGAPGRPSGDRFSHARGLRLVDSTALPAAPPAPVVVVTDPDLVLAGSALDGWVERGEVSVIACVRFSRLRAAVAPWLLRVRAERSAVLLAPVDERVCHAVDVDHVETPNRDGYALLVRDGHAVPVALALHGDASVRCAPPTSYTMASEEIVGFARTNSIMRAT